MRARVYNKNAFSNVTSKRSSKKYPRGGPRKHVTKYTVKSQQTLFDKLEKAPFVWQVSMVLTYSVENAPMTKEAIQKDLGNITRFLRRKVPGILYVWKKEFQRNELLHYHFLLSHDVGHFMKFYWEEKRKNKKCYVVRLPEANDTEAYREELRRRNWYQSKRDKQTELPEHFRKDGIGRFWGCSDGLTEGLEVLGLEFPVDEELEESVSRCVQQLSQDTHFSTDDYFKQRNNMKALAYSAEFALLNKEALLNEESPPRPPFGLFRGHAPFSLTPDLVINTIIKIRRQYVDSLQGAPKRPLSHGAALLGFSNLREISWNGPSLARILMASLKHRLQHTLESWYRRHSVVFNQICTWFWQLSGNKIIKSKEPVQPKNTSYDDDRQSKAKIFKEKSEKTSSYKDY